MHISREVFAQAAEKIPEIDLIMKKQGLDVKTVSMSELQSIIDKSGFKESYVVEYKKEKGARKEPISPIYSVKNGLKIQNVDKLNVISGLADAKSVYPIGMTSLLAEGMIDTSDVQFAKAGGNVEMYFSLKQEYLDSFQKLVVGSEALPKLRPERIMTQIQELIQNAKKYTPVEKSLLIAMGNITFGMPIIYHSDELKMQLPRQISSNYDVLWVELGVSFRDMREYEISEMAYNLRLPRGAIALKLVPLRYGVETKVEKTTKSPEVSFKTGQGEISIGEFFRRTVSFDYLRPIINAEGQGEAAFSWKLYDEAIASGTHQFAAIIGLPKGERSLSLAMSAHIQFQEYVVVNKIAGTEIHIFNTILN
jgi:hypothetical protein